MTRIDIVSDAHLLRQAEWVEDEEQLDMLGSEVLDNFELAIAQVERENPDAVILAGDMFDSKLASGSRVLHSEGEKYMARVRDALERLADNARCSIYALKGNHDSKSVLRSTEKALKGKFQYTRSRPVKIGDMTVLLMDSHYQKGCYDLPANDIQDHADLLVMHETIPLWDAKGLSRDSCVSICKNFDLVMNGHMHAFVPNALDITNFYVLPAFVPSREIKGNWMLSYKYPNTPKPEERTTPFGSILLDAGKISFQPYEPNQKIVRVEVRGRNAEDLLKGVTTVYETLSNRNDIQSLRVWLDVETDEITIQRVVRPEVAKFENVLTIDVQKLSKDSNLSPSGAVRSIEYGNKAFSLSELEEDLLTSLQADQKEIARMLFDRILTKDALTHRYNDGDLFQLFLSILSENHKTSRSFIDRAWSLAKGRA